MISSVQSRMARAALGLGVRELAKLADVSPNTIARLEAGERLHDRTLAYVRGALEALGISFISVEGASLAGGEGVRLSSQLPSTAMGRLLRRLADMPSRHEHPNEVRKSILNLSEDYLSILDAEARELDDWERISFMQMISSYQLKWYSLARANFVGAITPPDNRSEDYPIGEKSLHAARDITKDYVRKFIKEERAGAGA